MRASRLRWAFVLGAMATVAAWCSLALGVHDIPEGDEGGVDGASSDGTVPHDGGADTLPPDAFHGDAQGDAPADGSDATADGPADAPADGISDGSPGDQALPCGPSTCATGCCGTDGACHEEESSSECGSGGGSCSSCSAAQTCSGSQCADKCTPSNCSTGCCDSTGTCITATSNTQCGTQGAACGACSGNNQCVSGQCECTSSADCPMFQACDLTAHQCSSTCSATALCNGGCCNTTTGTCVQGTANGSCGTGGSNCTVCTPATGGAVCESSGSCGCNSSGDCPSGKACNTSTHQCTVSCSGGLICNGACCDGANCQPGNTNGACGVATSSCTSCTGYNSCASNACTTACTGAGACGSGGCCAGGQCQAGTLPAACGASCTNCTTNGSGHACMSGGTCGCNTSADCPVNLACQPGTHKCGQPCDGVTVLCNQGCCNGAACVAGTSTSDCGYNGELCVVNTQYQYYDLCAPVTGGGTPTLCEYTASPSCSGQTCSSYAAPLDGGALSVGTAAFAVSCSNPTYPQYTYGCQCGCNTLLDCPPPNTSCVSHLCQP